MAVLRSVNGESYRILSEVARLMLLEDRPSGVKFVFVDDDWGGGR